MDLQLNGMYGHSLVVIGRALIELGEIQERERYELRTVARQQPPENLAQAVYGTAIQGAEQIQADVAQPQAAEPEEKPAKKPKAAKSAAPAPSPTAPEEAAPASPAPAAESSPAITLVDLRAKLAELSRDGKADKVKALLADFGVAKLTELEPSKFAAVMAAAQEI